MRRQAIAAAAVTVGLALLAAPAHADTGVSWLSKERAYQRAFGLLERDQMAAFFDREPIIGWQLQPAHECLRLSDRRVRCSFVVRRQAPLEDCGATLTMVSRSWYIGWRISTHPGPAARCDRRAAAAAMGRPGRRAIDVALF